MGTKKKNGVQASDSDPQNEIQDPKNISANKNQKKPSQRELFTQWVKQQRTNRKEKKELKVEKKLQNKVNNIIGRDGTQFRDEAKRQLEKDAGTLGPPQFYEGSPKLPPEHDGSVTKAKPHTPRDPGDSEQRRKKMANGAPKLNPYSASLTKINSASMEEIPNFMFNTVIGNGLHSDREMRKQAFDQLSEKDLFSIIQSFPDTLPADMNDSERSAKSIKSEIAGSLVKKSYLLANQSPEIQHLISFYANSDPKQFVEDLILGHGDGGLEYVKKLSEEIQKNKDFESSDFHNALQDGIELMSNPPTLPPTPRTPRGGFENIYDEIPLELRESTLPPTSEYGPAELPEAEKIYSTPPRRGSEYDVMPGAPGDMTDVDITSSQPPPLSLTADGNPHVMDMDIEESPALPPNSGQVTPVLPPNSEQVAPSLPPEPEKRQRMERTGRKETTTQMIHRLMREQKSTGDNILKQELLGMDFKKINKIAHRIGEVNPLESKLLKGLNNEFNKTDINNFVELFKETREEKIIAEGNYGNAAQLLGNPPQNNYEQTDAPIGAAPAAPNSNTDAIYDTAAPPDAKSPYGSVETEEQRAKRFKGQEFSKESRETTQQAEPPNAESPYGSVETEEQRAKRFKGQEFSKEGGDTETEVSKRGAKTDAIFRKAQTAKGAAIRKAQTQIIKGPKDGGATPAA